MKAEAIWAAVQQRFAEIASRVKTPTYASDRFSLIIAAKEFGLRVSQEGTITIVDNKYRVQNWHFRSFLS